VKQGLLFFGKAVLIFVGVVLLAVVIALFVRASRGLM